MKRVLLLGGSGFLGTHVSRALARHDSVGACTPIGRSRLDLTDTSAEEIRDLVRHVGADVVVNCTGGLDGSRTALIAWQTATTALLLDALEGSDVLLVRLGSAGEYGPAPEGVSISEDAPTAPVSPYGISHLAATLLISEAATSGRVDGVTLRVFNPIGAGAGANNLLMRAANEFLQARDTGVATVTFGALSPWRDFIDARDVADAVVAVATGTQRRHHVYNVGSGASVRVRQAVTGLADVIGYLGDIDETGEGPSRSLGVPWTQARIDRMRTDFGWEPTRFLSDTLTDIARDADLARQRTASVSRQSGCESALPLPHSDQQT